MTCLGLDVGGTHTRAVLHDRWGRELGRATAAGGNPAARGAAEAVAVLAGVVGEALAGHAPGEVRGCLLGLSGISTLADREAFAEDCRTAFGLAVPVRLVHDAVVAFAAGAEGRGTVLIAGTGAVACRIDGTEVTARAGGLGWLLGDEGGGFWLGREAVRHAHAHPGDPFGRAVLAACEAADPVALVRWAYAAEPHRLATLAPLVSSFARRGEPAAVRIAERAAAHLAALVAELHGAAEPAPIVLAGTVATAPGPIHDRLLTRLRAAHPAAPVTLAGDGATAAARLAALGV
ncbi:N-acetylglucosamine kinase [Kitasatospora sp. NPDC006697]|uniref:N-acetylglucosamine kinase n=1 Tax=Kitasatospora sp. NPDC006697 TaxID=3364020 RepID=UPI0036798FEA